MSDDGRADRPRRYGPKVRVHAKGTGQGLELTELLTVGVVAKRALCRPEVR